ncbi:putative WD-repeat protein [Hibiscus syriacus]|uniref:WD-repeat protein n=1 Tax=Hibiscus syriacus TaxID=106335 RepID=A0A6A2YNW9_HIBSY|nr:putative WD-repeat protein [Hibiscus syriacus]
MCHLLIDDDKPLLPIIDISKPDAYDLIRDAYEKWGVFQVINHGLLVARPPLGIIKYGMARISSFYPKLMWSVGYRMMGSPVEHARQLWPQDHAKFCEVMEQCQAKMKTMCEKMVAMILGSLGLTHGENMKWFEPQNGGDRTQCVLQLNSYPVCPDPDRIMGVAPHTETSLITLLDQCNINGLQVYKDGEGWVAVEAMEGALVVNLGDLMHIVSNGKFKSVLHRAVVNKTHHRISTVFFYGPPCDAKVSPLRKLVDFDHPPLYQPVMWKEYVEIKKSSFSKALESIRL